VEESGREMEKFRREGANHNRCGRGILFTCLILWLSCTGCSTLKKSAIVATGTAIGATAASALSGGALAPVVMGATTSAFVTDAVIEVTDTTPTTQVINKAPDNFFTIIGKLVSLGGWTLILIFIVPMVLGWILPGPLQIKKKN
jgi:sugar (pentulose or hexulose) kinase